MDEKKTAHVFFAWAHGAASKEVEVKRYIGVGAFKCVAVNPSRAEIDRLYGNDPSDAEEPVYAGTGKIKLQDGTEKEVQQVRITFYMKTDTEKTCNNGIDAIIPVSFFLRKAYNTTVKNGVLKCQVLDKYGNSAWVTEEQLKGHIIPTYTVKNGPDAGQERQFSITSDYHPAYIGEEDLVKFLRALINIPSPRVWNSSARTFTMKTGKKLEECESSLDSIKKYFEGNVKELREIVGYQPDNCVKLLMGIRTASNGSQFQATYTRMPMYLNVRNYDSLIQQLKDDEAAGRHPSEYYEVCDLKEYTLTPTVYKDGDTSKETAIPDNPYAAPAQDAGEEDISEEDMPLGDPFAGV